MAGDTIKGHPRVAQDSSMDERSPRDVEERFIELANELFGFNVRDYLRHAGRTLSGLLIVEKGARFEPFFNHHTALMKIPVSDVQAGFHVNVGERVGSDVHTDVLIVHKSRLADAGPDFDALLMHEIAHMLSDSDVHPHAPVRAEAHSDLAARLARLRWLAEDDHHNALFFTWYLEGAERLASMLGESFLQTARRGLQHEYWVEDAMETIRAGLEGTCSEATRRTSPLNLQ